MESKICIKCNINRLVSDFYKDKGSSDGCYSYCKNCKKKLDKEYRDLNKDKIKISLKKYYNLNKKEIMIQHKTYNSKNKNRINLNKNTWKKNKIINDNLFKLQERLRTAIAFSFRVRGYSKKTNTAKILGCTFEEFKIYLESKFEPWMTWENRGKYNGELNYGWDIDHVIPLSSAKTEEDIISLNHHTNLQPLCSKYNRDIKRDNV